jgi:hypothetical protein
MFPDNIPSEMKLFPHWVCWKFENKGGSKLSKVPYNPINGKRADVTAQNTWASFDTAYSQAHFYNGIGFVFSSENPFCLIDLDTVLDPIEQSYQKWISENLNSYSEISPSGGLHIICQASIPSGKRKSFVEIYSNNRFGTVTGNVYNPMPVVNLQEKVQALWDSIPTGINNFSGNIDGPEIFTDYQIWEKASSAENGAKFLSLWNGDIFTYHQGDHSAADFAIINIIAFYTQNREQIKRIFRTSALGKRDKALREKYVDDTISKAFDRIVPEVDVSSYVNTINAIIDDTKNLRHFGKLTKKIEVLPVEIPTRSQLIKEAEESEEHKEFEITKNFDLETPPGAVGQLAEFIYQQANKPVKQIAIVAALGMMAGITGRAYNVSGTGLNSYFLLLATTGRGKEAMARGTSKIFKQIGQIMPQFLDFSGPSDLASAQGLIRYMSDHPTKSFFSVFGEFGIKLKTICNPKAYANDLLMQRALLDFYSKSGATDIILPTAYSDSTKNTKSLESPAFSFIGETAPDWFYDNVDEHMIRSGLLPRMIIIEYAGKRPPTNENCDLVVPTVDLLTKLQTIATCSLNLIGTRVPCPVRLNTDAIKLSKKLDIFCDERINESKHDSLITELFNRTHLKTLKIAGLIAVGVNPVNPIIDAEIFMWAEKLIMQSTLDLERKFATGQIGSSGDEQQQLNFLKSVMLNYLIKPFHELNGKTTTLMHTHKILPYSYLSYKVCNNKNFKNGKNGPTQSLKNALQTMKDRGMIVEIEAKQLISHYNYNGRGFLVHDEQWLHEVAIAIAEQGA